MAQDGAIYPPILFITLPIILISNIYFFTWESSVYHDLKFSLYQIVLSCILGSFSIIGHELGHSSAAKHFKIDPNEVGFGFYLFFPVLYSDITDIWVLPKKKRILINLGGVFIQLMINAMLIIASLITTNTGFLCLCETIIHINIFMIVFSLLPFTRNDGYWVVSDLFNIPNLNHKSNTFPIRFLNNIYTNRIKLRFNAKELIVGIYSICNYLFIYYLLTRFIRTFYQTTQELIQIDYTQKISLILSSNISSFISAIIILVISIILGKSILSWIRTITVELNIKRS